MFIPSRNVWHPLGRASAKPAPPPEPLDQDEPPDIDQEDVELSDVEDEDAELSDADFYRQLRQSIEGVQAGVLPVHEGCDAASDPTEGLVSEAQTSAQLQAFLRLG